MPRVTETYDTNNEFDWSYTRTTYSKGRVDEIYTLYDDGSEGTKYHNRGNLISEVRTDNPDDGTTNPWAEIRTTYEENGAVDTVHTIYDDGTTQDDQYANGVISQSVLYDNPANNAENWERIERQYDNTGQLQTQHTVYDNGIVLDENCNRWLDPTFQI